MVSISGGTSTARQFTEITTTSKLDDLIVSSKISVLRSEHRFNVVEKCRNGRHPEAVTWDQEICGYCACNAADSCAALLSPSMMARGRPSVSAMQLS